MKLLDVIKNLNTFESESCILATKPWTPDSEAAVVETTETGDLSIVPGMEYFIEVFIAKEFLEGWELNLDKHPSLLEKCEILIQYAINDA